MKKNCNICGANSLPIYTARNYKMVPLCMDCYKSNRKPAKNKYKKLMNKLAAKGYVWVLNVGETDFPFTLFGIEIPFFQIVQYFFEFVNADDYSLQSQDDFVFDFNDYPDPIVVESCITFVNNNDGSTYSLNIRLGLIDDKSNSILFFTDKQLGLVRSNLNNYASIAIDKDGSIMKIVPDYAIKKNGEENLHSIFEDAESPRHYMEEDEVAKLVGFWPESFE